MTKKTRRKYQTVTQAREVEYAEQKAKEAFACACGTARKLGFDWYYEGEMIWVKTADGEVGCNGRQDFIDLVFGKLRQLQST